MKGKISIIVLLLLLIGGIIALIQSQKQQDVRQHAAPNTCAVTQAICKWDPQPGAIKYLVTITEVDTNTVIKTQDVSTPSAELAFSAQAGKTYKCDVSAVNVCGAGQITSATSTCPLEASPSATLTPTPISTTSALTETPTATPTLTPTPTVTNTPTPLPTGVTPTITPTPTPGPSATPTLTPAITPTLTPTLAPSPTPTPTVFVTPTPIPTIRPGSIGTTVVVGTTGIFFVIIGLALFLLL